MILSFTGRTRRTAQQRKLKRYGPKSSNAFPTILKHAATKQIKQRQDSFNQADRKAKRQVCIKKATAFKFTDKAGFEIQSWTILTSDNALLCKYLRIREKGYERSKTNHVHFNFHSASLCK